ncbi:ribbon-helix-helix protein, CopG family [Leptolyngbya sp. PL-A2]
MPTNKAKLGVYVDQELKAHVEKLAALESRSVSNFIEILLKELVANAKAEGKLQ